MNWFLTLGLLEFATIWLSISIVVIATSWYLASTISSLWPKWWERNIAAPDPGE